MKIIEKVCILRSNLQILVDYSMFPHKNSVSFRLYKAGSINALLVVIMTVVCKQL